MPSGRPRYPVGTLGAGGFRRESDTKEPWIRRSCVRPRECRLAVEARNHQHRQLREGIRSIEQPRRTDVAKVTSRILRDRLLALC